MTSLEEILRSAERHIDYSDTADVPNEVFGVLRALVGDVQALQEAAQRPPITPADGISRVDALKLAREHVEAMATNARGYQDGVKLSDKVQAIDTFARFLLGE